MRSLTTYYSRLINHYSLLTTYHSQLIIYCFCIIDTSNPHGRPHDHNENTCKDNIDNRPDRSRLFLLSIGTVGDRPNWCAATRELRCNEFRVPSVALTIMITLLIQFNYIKLEKDSRKSIKINHAKGTQKKVQAQKR